MPLKELTDRGASPREVDVESFSSPTFLRAVAQLLRFNRDDSTTLLIEGDSGTGKTRIARYLHFRSRRKEGPFVHAPLSSMDDSLVGSDLFGHISGAYTGARSSRAGLFASARGGTLFLDEVGKASPGVQQKLLNVIENGEVRPLGADRSVHFDVRLMFATNVSLETRVDAGAFLPDLYARICTFRTRLPALCERREDIPLLVRSAVDRHAASCGYSNPPLVSEELGYALKLAPWKYNLRELDGAVHRLLLEAEGAPVLGLEHCDADLAYLRNSTSESAELTADRITSALAKSRNNKSEAARLLGVDRTTLYRRQRKLVSDQPVDRQQAEIDR